MPQGLMSDRSPDQVVTVTAEEAPSKVSTDRSGKEISADTTFPPIRPGGSLLLAWQIRGRTVLLVGGGVVASGRLTKILESDANCILVSPPSGLAPETRYRIFDESRPATPTLTYRARAFDPEVDFEGVDMVMTAIDDNPLSKSIHAESKRRHIPVNVADVPPLCDFYFGSEIRDGPLQILVSTNGRGPKLANQVRRRVQASLPPGIGRAITNVGTLREKLRKLAPGVGGELGASRMKWMIDVCEAYDTTQLAHLTDAQMDTILGGWQDGSLSVPDTGRSGPWHLVPGFGRGRGRWRGCPLGFKRQEGDAGCPWGFKREVGVLRDSKVLSLGLGIGIGALLAIAIVRSPLARQ